MPDVHALMNSLHQAADTEKAAFFPRFFKAGPGGYAEGDRFLGVTVPKVRAAIKPYTDLPLKNVDLLLTSPWHEERLAAVLILVAKYKKGDDATRKAVYDFYLGRTKYINNWDLVDSSAEHIVGPWLDGKSDQMPVLLRLAHSGSLWERRIAMLSTFSYIKQGRADEALIIAEQLLHDQHDLIQKAVGWMLRETGKRVDHSLLCEFMDQHAATMPRTTLRYALEHFTSDSKQYYMQLARQ